MMKGWTGKRLRIDLSRGKIESEPLSLDYLKSSMGGRGLNVSVFSEETKTGLDPFDPDTPFCLAVGPLTGTCSPCAATFCAASISPLLSPPTYANSSMGGHWGAELKFAGYDQIIIIGKAERPTYIWINDDDVALRDAIDLWGKDTHQTTIRIQEELKDRAVQVLCIGQAGEHLVRYASLVNSFFWDSGRLGLGAVMGSKNIKAVAVRGSRSVVVHDPEHLATVCKGLIHKIQRDPRIQRLSSEGTLLFLNDRSKNFLERQRESSGSSPREINSRYYHQQYFFSKEGCFSCPIHCGRYTYIKSGPFEGAHFGGVHGESVIALGPEIGNNRWDFTLKMIQLCMRYGLDPVSTGGTIAWIMKAFDQGLLRGGEMDDMTFQWRNAESALQLIEKIAKREGVGDTLAEGTLRASRMVGHTGEELITHVKGLELVGLKKMNSALHATLSTGDWDYLKNVIGFNGDMKHDQNGLKRDGRSETESIASSSIDTITRKVKRTEDTKCATDLAGVCSFPYAKLPVLSLADLAEQLSAVTGLGIDKDDLINLSEKSIEAERNLAGRDGVSRGDEERFPIERLQSEKPEAKGFTRQEWRNMLSQYYALRNWDTETGLPQKNSLTRETSEVSKTSEV